MSYDQPDYTVVVTYQLNVPDIQISPVIPRPKGGELATGSVTSTSSYQTVASHTPTSGKEFQLAKVVISCENATWVKYRWNATDISAERLLDDRAVLIEHSPWGYKTMLGDGSKAFDVQVKYYSSPGTVNVEIIGEEVTPE